jgi:hypothetical protein
MSKKKIAGVFHQKTVFRKYNKFEKKFREKTSQFGYSNRVNPLSQKSGNDMIALIYHLFANDIYMIVYHFLGRDIDII